MKAVLLLVAVGVIAVPALADGVGSAVRPGATQGASSLLAQPGSRPDRSPWMGGKNWYRPEARFQGYRLAQSDGSPSAQGDAADGDAADGAAGGGNVLGDANEIARQSNNPLGGDFIIWLNFFSIDRFTGKDTNTGRYAYEHLFQPVIPIRLPSLGENWIVVNRPTISTTLDRDVGRPDPEAPGGIDYQLKSGFGDIEYFALLGTSTPTESGWLAESFGVGDAVLAAGVTTRWPTGRQSLSENVFAAGPAMTAAYIGSRWTLATLIQHWWDYDKTTGGDDFNFSRIQLFYYRSLPNGWQIGGSPKLTADWTASSHDRWTVPLGIGVFKTLFVGKQPIKLGVEFRTSLTRPRSFGSDWQVEFQIIPITRNFIADWLKKGGKKGR